MQRPVVLATLILCLGPLAGFAPAGAVVRYVDPAAPGPVHDGTTWENAFTTLNAVLVEARSGDTIRVATGSYGEAITMKEDVALLGGFPGAADPNGPRDPTAHPSVLLGPGGATPIVSAPSGLTPMAVLDGFLIQTEASSGVYCTASAPTLSHNVFEVAGVAITCGAGGGPRVLNNVFRGGATAVFSTDAAPLVAGNLIWSYPTGVHIGGGTSGDTTGGTTGGTSAVLANNTIVWCTVGLSIASTSPLIANNILALNETGLRADRAVPEFSHNDVFGNGTDYAGVADPTGARGNVRADPHFANVDADDYHLANNSPGVDAGDDASIFTDDDLDGGTRVRGLRVDLGAYEFVPTVPTTAEALRLAAGLHTAAPADLSLLNVETSNPSAGLVDILDAVRIMRGP